MPIEIVSFAHSLASSRHFEMVDPADLEMVLGDSDEPIELRIVEPSADEPLIRSGSTFTHLLFVQHGIIVPWQYPYSELKAPFLIGDHELLTSAERWVANYSAVTNAMVADIPRAVMERIMERIPGVRDRVHELVMARLARSYWTSLAISGTPVSRVAAALVYRLVLEGKDYGEDKKLRIAQSDLARLTAMSRFGAADGLKKLRDDKKAIVFGDRFSGKVCVPDVERLKNEAFAEVRDQAIRPLLLRSDGGDGQPPSILSATGNPRRSEPSDVEMEQPHAPARSHGPTSERGQFGGDARLFNCYAAVDWSASSRRARGSNSIWIAVCGADGPVELVNPGTRNEAMSHIELLLDMTTAEGGRMLCGFDFPFGYPEGTAQKLSGCEGWEAVWTRIAEIIIDSPDNTNNRFEAAAQLNQAFDGEGPFWGWHQSNNNLGLSPKRPQRDQEQIPRLKRHAEEMVPRAQGVWKLWGPGAVGGKALTGIAALERLRQRRGDVKVWPFETLGEGSAHVLAEIYPSLVVDPCPGNEALDARRVKAMAEALRELDRQGELKSHLQAPKKMPGQVRHEEGAILGMHDQEGFRAVATSRST